MIFIPIRARLSQQETLLCLAAASLGKGVARPSPGFAFFNCTKGFWGQGKSRRIYQWVDLLLQHGMTCRLNGFTMT